jgi:hypothetical protein
MTNDKITKINENTPLGQLFISSISTTTADIRFAMGKKPKHRVRHVPPGPCGIWFQAIQAKKKQQRNKIRDKSSIDGEKRSTFSGVAVASNGPTGQSGDEHNSEYEMSQQNPYTQDHDGRSPAKISHKLEDTPSAWQEMQNDTNVTTPYNPTPWTTVIDPEERYQVVRNNLPEHYVTLWEILRGDCDMKLAPHQRLRVLVYAVEMSHHHNIWTVDLRDDTGASMRAWMEPRFIQEQLQNNMMDENEMSMIRPGLVWMLRDVSMMIVHSALTGSSSTSSKISEERIERMLLISGENVEKIWYPTEKEKDDDDVQQRQQQTTSCHNALAVNSNNDRSQPPECHTTIEATASGKQSMDHEYRSNDDDVNDCAPIENDVFFCESRRDSYRPLESLDVNSTSDSRPCTQLSPIIRKKDRRVESTVGSADSSHPSVICRPTQQRRQHDDSVDESCFPGHVAQRSSQTLTIETTTVNDSQEHSVAIEQSQSIQTPIYSTQEASLNTQESNFLCGRDASGISAKIRHPLSQAYQQQKRDHRHTPKSSQPPKIQRTKHRTTHGLSPARSTPCKSPKKSPRKFFTVGSMWETPSEFILDMIEQEEKESLSQNKPRSCHPTSHDESSLSVQSQTSAVYRINGGCEKLYDPSFWAGVDMEALDECY